MRMVNVPTYNCMIKMNLKIQFSWPSVDFLCHLYFLDHSQKKDDGFMNETQALLLKNVV